MKIVRFGIRNNPKYSNLINFQNVTFSDKERAYLIVKAVVRLSDPAAMDLVLRKRISFNIYKRHSITDKIRRRMGHTSSLTSLGVFYEVVSNIPKVSIQMVVLRFRIYLLTWYAIHTSMPSASYYNSFRYYLWITKESKCVLPDNANQVFLFPSQCKQTTMKTQKIVAIAREFDLNICMQANFI